MNNARDEQAVALAQINNIFSILEQNFKTALSGSLMIATGVGIMLIPLCELLFAKTIDPVLSGLVGSCMSSSVIFGLRTLFYWTCFSLIGRRYASDAGQNALIKKIFDGIGKPFPIIAVTTAASMACAGYSAIIAPMMLLLVGILFFFFAQFTATLVRYHAFNLIIAGIAGIWLSLLHLPFLWMLLVIYQGCSFVVMGIMLNKAVLPDSTKS
jgi:hypothetical protein